VIRRKTNRRHMIDDHRGRTTGRATLQVRAVDGILGTHKYGPRRFSKTCLALKALTGASNLRFWCFVAGQSTSRCGLNRRLFSGLACAADNLPICRGSHSDAFMSRRAKVYAPLIPHSPCRLFSANGWLAAQAVLVQIGRFWRGLLMQYGSSEGLGQAREPGVQVRSVQAMLVSDRNGPVLRGTCVRRRRRPWLRSATARTCHLDRTSR
jgi:hypothetical protein